VDQHFSATMTHTTVAVADLAPAAVSSFEDRRRTADRVFRGALIFNTGLTILWLVAIVTGRTTSFFQSYRPDREAVLTVAEGILFFYVLWGFIWYAVKTLLLRFAAGFTKEERRQAFSSRMREPFDVAGFVSRHSERRIRIIDMIGRRGRFITLAMAGFFICTRGCRRNSPRPFPCCSSRTTSSMRSPRAGSFSRSTMRTTF
jgi:hypothetical protein